MGKFEDLTGRVFGELTVVEKAPSHILPCGKSEIMWKCKCSCGNDFITRAASLKSGRCKSCGHLQKETAASNAKKLFKKNNTYDLSGDYGIGWTSKGNEFYFDLDDYDKIKDYCWYIDSAGYVTNKNGKDIIRMHQLVLPIESGLMADHIHGKETRNDNRKSNLRIVTPSQNEMNKGVRQDNTSGVTGVYFQSKSNRWCAEIVINGEKHRLGSFIDKNDAVNARKDAERKYFGEYAYDYSQKMEV